MLKGHTEPGLATVWRHLVRKRSGSILTAPEPAQCSSITGSGSPAKWWSQNGISLIQQRAIIARMSLSRFRVRVSNWY